MSANQVTGLHTRLEGSRKYLFGNMLVYGTTNASKIVYVATAPCNLHSCLSSPTASCWSPKFSDEN